MVKQFDNRFLSIIEGAISTEDNNTINAIRNYMKDRMNTMNEGMGNVISYIAECDRLENNRDENYFYNLVAQAFLQ